MTIPKTSKKGESQQRAFTRFNHRASAPQSQKRFSARSLTYFSFLSFLPLITSHSSLAAAPKENIVSIFAVKQNEANKKTAPPNMPGEVVPESELPQAYNAPSVTTLRGKDGKRIPDLFVDLSFIYYHASEEGLDLAESASFIESSTTVIAPSKSKVLKQPFSYEPGFKAGIGANICDWTLFGQYTWIRQFNKVDKRPPTPSPNNGTPVWFMDDWFILGIPVEGQSMPATKLESKWHLDMDIADLTLGRPYYLARNISISPFFGLRSAWIRQKMNIKINVPPLNTVTNQRSKIFSRNSSNSWSIGPRAGLGASLLLPKGFRFQGDLSGSILFTDYTKVHHAEQVVNADNNPSVINVNNNGMTGLRPVAELGLGLGWGSYFCKQKGHFDLSINYDFSIWWSQNMIRRLVDETAIGSGAYAGDLNLHGLDIAVRFDF